MMNIILWWQVSLKSPRYANGRPAGKQSVSAVRWWGGKNAARRKSPAGNDTEKIATFLHGIFWPILYT